jgi:phytoene desaturase
MQHSKTIVIGAGIGGLATAIRLACRGVNTTVFEKNERAGGKLSLIEKNGYRFDGGPSLFTQPGNIEELFTLAKEPLENYISWKTVDLACRYFFENGKVINAYTNKEKFARELEEVAGEDGDALKNYLAKSADVFEHTGNIFLNYSLHKTGTWFNKRILSALKHTGFNHLFTTLNDFNEQRFRSPETVQIFNRFATYNGSNPYKAPGMLSLIPHLEHNEGVFYPAGGMISIADALYRLALKKGVNFHFNAGVDEIKHDKGKVTGVNVGGRFFPSDIVVSNVDAYFTYSKLLHQPDSAADVLKRERSSSAMIFYWGIKKEFPRLSLHNIFFSKNYREEFDHLFTVKKMYHDPTVYINITSKEEPVHAPEGCENWFVMVNAPATTGPVNDTVIAETRKQVLSKLQRMLGEDIGSLIEVEEVLTPYGIETLTDSYMGSLYGTSSNSKWAAFLRHPNFSSSISGLYFAGGSVHPGGGIPLCFKSAKIVDSLINP